MLLSVRERMKSTVFIIIIILFIVPMVLSGIGGDMLGSVAGSDAATVDGESISKSRLNREIYFQKQRILSQGGVDANSEFLKDENLREPVLNRLTRELALMNAARDSGMNISDQQVFDAIVQQDQFHVDGKFDEKRYRDLLANVGITPALYKDQMTQAMVLSQQSRGLENSSFVTQAELDALVSIIQEKRSFEIINIKETEEMSKAVEVSDDEIAAHYEENKQSFNEPEKVVVNYVELNVDDIAKKISITDDQIRQEYEAELENFDASPELEIAHILIEEKDDGSHQAKLTELKTKIDAGEEFSDLAKTYSDDAGTSENGGVLGVMTEGTFPEFEPVVKNLDQGQVSEGIKTDAGTHFVKVVSKKVNEPASFDERKEAIRGILQRNQAETQFVADREQLEVLTFGAPDLKDAANQLGLEVQTSSPFALTGVTNSEAIIGPSQRAAFEPDVLNEGRNSPVVELANDHVVVLRKKEHFPERIKELAEVKDEIKTQLVEQKVKEQLESQGQALIAMWKEGKDPSALAEERKLEYKKHESVTRNDINVDRMLVGEIFSLSDPQGGALFETAETREGLAVVKLTGVEKGDKKDMPDQQLKGLSAQLARESSRMESTAFEETVVSKAEIKIN